MSFSLVRTHKPIFGASYLRPLLLLPLVATVILGFQGCASNSVMKCPTKDPKVAAQMLRDGENRTDYEKFLLARQIYKKKDAAQALCALKGIKRMRDVHEKVRRELERTVGQYGNSAQELQLAAWKALMVLKEGCFTFGEENVCVIVIVKAGDIEIAAEALPCVYRPASRQALEALLKGKGR